MACRADRLTGAQRARLNELRGRLESAVRETRELADGYALLLPEAAGMDRALAEWLALEARCCPFLRYEVDRTAAGEIRVAITGGAGAKAFLRENLPRT